MLGGDTSASDLLISNHDKPLFTECQSLTPAHVTIPLLFQVALSPALAANVRCIWKNGGVTAVSVGTGFPST